MQENTTRHKRYADHLLTRAQRQLASMTASNKALIVTTSIVLVIGGVGVGTYARKQQKNLRRYQSIIQSLRHESKRVPIIEEATALSPVMDRDKEIMTESTKLELLKKLERFESSQQFTDRNISIAVLAGKMKTNTKYLSYIINKYRNKDFNSYINELRIKYIIAKMEADRRYFNYKISYLAEECGFATHSQFTTVFRGITGLSPSTFIAYLKKDERVDV